MAAQFGSNPDLKKLNDFLLSRSYIDGWTVSGEDVAVFRKISKPSNKHENILRWWNHINSFENVFSGLESALGSTPANKQESKAVNNDNDDDESDDDDFFASSDDEDEEAKAAAEELKAKRVAEYNARKAEKAQKKGVVAAKSSITFDVKPWDDETDLDALCVEIKKIEMDGLVWGTAQKKPLAYGIFKLSIVCVVEDDKVGSDDLVEKIEAFEDHVQSVDIAAFNKI
jgi:elongation factor 1-beta